MLRWSILLSGWLIFSARFALADSFDLSDLIKHFGSTHSADNNNIITNVSQNMMYCHPDYCQVNNPCTVPLLCESYDCNMTWCRDPSLVTDTGMMKDVFYKHHCAGKDPDICPGASICPELMGCDCQRNWTGEYGCNIECQLQCLHGICTMLDTDPDTDNPVFCNCEASWEGTLCDTPTVDYKEKEEQERLAREREEKKVRIMSGVVAASLTTALIVAIVLPVVLWRMRVIFVMKLVYYFKSYEDNDDKLYDAYVSMTPTANAEKFVYRELQPKLENLGFKLYLQARDSPAGKVISESILEAVEKSRCTIMIVTPDYVTNEWNRFEYLIAQHETIKLKQKIIPIILEQVDKSNMDKSLQHILDSVKCLRHPSIKLSTYRASRSYQYIIINNPPDINNSKSNVGCGVVGKQQRSYEQDIKKFWKRLELTLPKKKNHQDAKVKTAEGRVNQIIFKNSGCKYKAQTSIDQNYGTINQDISGVRQSDTLIYIEDEDKKEIHEEIRNLMFSTDN